MLSFLYTAVKYALEYRLNAKENTDDVNNIIDRIENAYKESTSLTQKSEDIRHNSCCYKTGHVTFISTDYVLIDNHYKYDIVHNSIDNLKVGDQVHYLVSENGQTDEHKIKKLISVISSPESWDNEISVPQENTVNTQTLKKCIIGKVTNRENRMVFVDPNNISFDLNNVHSEFIPVIGDWLKLESVTEVNENSVDLSGQILVVKKIQPLRSKLDVGTISSYDPTKEVGTIGNNIIFSKRICDPGYVPCIGDKVISDSIESDQGVHTWRSLTIVPIVQVPKKSLPLPDVFTSQLSTGELKDLLKNKKGIIISTSTCIDLELNQEKSVTVNIRNTSKKPYVLCKSYSMLSSEQSQLSLNKSNDKELVLDPLQSTSLVFNCKAKLVGTTEELYIFEFKEFKIGRIFRINCNNKTRKNTLCPPNKSKNKNYDCIANLSESDQLTYIPGTRPYTAPPFIKVRNVIFRVPRRYWDIVLENMKEGKSQIQCEQTLTKAIPCLANSLSFQSYRERFHALLYLEEIAETINMEQYSMKSVIMKHCGEYLAMEVPGLVEKRPSLLVGDRAIISFKWDTSEGKLKYEGFIHKITNKEIFLKFNRKFHEQYNNEDCQVSFKCSHSSLQYCHNAVNLAMNRLGPDVLFPTHVTQKESQLNLEEIEIQKTPSLTKLSHQRNNSVSSESCCTSSSTTRSSSRVSVVERLFNIKPIGWDAELTRDPPNVSELDSNQYSESNVAKNTQDDGNTSFNAKISNDNSKRSKSVDDKQYGDNVLEPYIMQVKKRKLIWFNKNLNHYQKEAVRNVLKGFARPLPYIIFGPPGTGKTMTLCETILQILTVIPESRILVATPSNSSANLIAERLLDSGILEPGDMVRLIAHHLLGSDSISEKLLPYCTTADIGTEWAGEKNHYNDKMGRKVQHMSVLGRHRITIGTCIALGILNNMGFPRGHFSHVLVDEAGQATEPQILVPLNFIHSDHGQIVLAGDPLQLGPVIQSALAKSFGLQESILSRLLHHFPYQRDPDGFETQYDPRLVTRLVMNYRSLPEILELSSSLFYDSELQAQVSPSESKEAKMLQKVSPILPERNGTPPAIVFHGVRGENCKDFDSPSWYNPEEATQVYIYLLKLYKYGVSADDIGIITPYLKQVMEIRELLQELDVELPKISSVEGFQGQEKKVIIISTVRSSVSFVNEDIKHSLGFVACPRRLNVAITRARALLIIIGNPILLARDPYWRNVLVYCTDRGAYTGCTFFPSDLEEACTDLTENLITNAINN